ncbi:hypothetical protein PR002_g21320 [Phytophthora rubi]|uniref:Uncharacterized protein n=1 Tax=Phytophthora rubi TaxID=129364 RepID=A0A6A3J3R0_9STRA|nr:hypothetical protein PR002_g21320 [Phytophthora rubi]
MSRLKNGRIPVRKATWLSAVWSSTPSSAIGANARITFSERWSCSKTAKTAT